VAATKIGRVTLPADARCEIVRSFSYKLNVGQFESRDFFCSQKAACRIAEAEDISERLYRFCKSQVMRSVNEYLRVNPIRTNERKAS
jgi:hypothetical protein